MRTVFLVLLVAVSCEKSLQNAEGLICGRACYYLVENMFNDLSQRINDVMSSKSNYEQQMTLKKSKIRSFEKCYEKISAGLAEDILENRSSWERFPHLARVDYSELKYLQDFVMNSEMLQFFEVAKQFEKKVESRVRKNRRGGMRSEL